MKQYSVEIVRDNRVTVINVEAKDEGDAIEQAHAHINLRVTVREVGKR